MSDIFAEHNDMSGLPDPRLWPVGARRAATHAAQHIPPTIRLVETMIKNGGRRFQRRIQIHIAQIEADLRFLRIIAQGDREVETVVDALEEDACWLRHWMDQHGGWGATA
ncbi:hypothetical protein OHQ89_16240 [Streptomyces canus]|uniref:hypothetical protein n=1 Tax=Streptomyces canus TaxID=58343 RepID=UPI0030E278C8